MEPTPESSELILRRATAADVARIVELLADDAIGRAREELGPPLPAAYGEAFAAIDGDPNQLLAVAERGGQVVACLQLTFIPGLSRRGLWRGLIEGVRVDAALRGGGIGAQVLRWAIDECRRRGCGLIELTSDERRRDARRFYERLGFTASHVGMKLLL